MRTISFNIYYRIIVATILAFTFNATQAQTPAPIPPAYPSTTPLNYSRSWISHYPTTDYKQVINPARTNKEVTQRTQYFDGITRPLQNVVKGVSPDGKDLVTPFIYDENGKETLKYLPYISTSETGLFKINPFSEQATYMQNRFAGEDFFYGKNTFEASPLNRIQSSAAAGKNWVGSNHTVTTGYGFNTANDAVRIWNLQDGTGGVPATTAIYPSGELYRNTSTDENGQQTVSFSNNSNQLILKMVASENPGINHQNWNCTYYVYDDFGHLRWILSPKATEYLRTHSWNLTDQEIISELCFSYEYDDKNRVISKTMPGAKLEEYVYDNLDRLVFSRTGNMRNASQPKWNITLYDEDDRPIMQGHYLSSSSRVALQNIMDAASGSTTITHSIPGPTDIVIASRTAAPPGYQASNSITFTAGFESAVNDEFTAEIVPGLTVGNITLQPTSLPSSINNTLIYPLIYTFYDTYQSTAPAFKSGDLNNLKAGINPYPEIANAFYDKLRGFVTGTKERVLGTEQWLSTTYYYDNKKRILQTIADNISGGQDVTSKLYDFNGNVLSQYTRITNPRAGQTPETTVLTMYEYGIDYRLKYVRKELNNDNTTKLLVTSEYNSLGQLQKKIFGDGLESLEYDYTIHGWMNGINRKYLNDQESHYFGMELAYDKTTSIVNDASFAASQYTGNVAGTMWRSSSDGKRRMYDYSYDLSGQLLKADFKQQDGTWGKTVMDFTTQLGDGLHTSSAYDQNGNILQMSHKGMRGTSIVTIDQLIYKYSDKSNKLSYIKDDQNDENSSLGDFKESAANHTANLSDTPDYLYDDNGNLLKDNNKSIDNIKYNHLNLPEEITITGKGTMSYLYAASGIKLRRTVVDNSVTPSATNTTDYINSAVYENDSLRFLSHEEGRIRPVFSTEAPIQYVYDYFIPDQLGNIRIILTEQTNFSMYLATMEQQNAPGENAIFNNVDNSRSKKPVGYPNDQSAGNNSYVAKLNGSQPEKRVGPSLILKVMAGDTVSLGAKVFYKSTGIPQKKSLIPAADMTKSLLLAFGGVPGVDAGKDGTAQQGVAGPLNEQFLNNQYQRLKEKEPGHNNQNNRPKAYLNFALFDEQFNLVDENSGVKQAQAEPDQLQTLAQDKMVLKKSGFLYVYTSNETPQDVYFDNVVVTLSNGPLLEETHYYPFGLTMHAISTKAAGMLENRHKYNGIELNSNFDLFSYETLNRNLDPQTGRWWQIDPKFTASVAESPYVSMGNNPIRHSDPLGDYFFGLFGSTSKQRQEARRLASELENSGSYNYVTVDNITKRSINVQTTSIYDSYDQEAGKVVPTVNVRKIHITEDGKPDFGNSIENYWYEQESRLNATSIINSDGSLRPKPYSGKTEYVPLESIIVPLPPLARALTRTAEVSPNILYHYTTREAAESIAAQGLKVGRDGFSYLTNKATLSPLQAQIELALPANRIMPNTVLRIDVTGMNPEIIRRVTGNLPGYGAGGGTEFLFKQLIPAERISIVP